MPCIYIVYPKPCSIGEANGEGSRFTPSLPPPYHPSHPCIRPHQFKNSPQAPVMLK